MNEKSKKAITTQLIKADPNWQL